MEVSIFERVLRIVERRTGRFLDTKINKDFDKVKPFDKEPVSPKEKLYMYEHIDPEVKMKFQEADPIGFMDMEKQMETLRRRYYGRS